MNWKLLNRFNCFLVRISKRVGLSAREGSVESHRVGLVGDGRTTCGRTGTARRSITRVSRPKIRCRWPRTPPRSSRATPSRLVTRRPTTACAPGWPTTAPSPPSKVQSTDLHWQRMCFFFWNFIRLFPRHSEGHRPLWPVYGEYLFVPPQRWLHSVEHGWDLIWMNAMIL